MPKPTPTSAPSPAPNPAPAPTEPTPIEQFTPENFVIPADDDDVARPIAPSPAPTPTPTAPAPRPAPVDPKDAKKRENADIRAQLEAANQRAKEAEERLQKQEEERLARITALEKERDDLNNKHTDVSTRFAELNRQLSMEDPLRAEEVQSILRPWNQRVDTIAKDISDTGGNGKSFRSMLPEMVNSYKAIGDENSDGYQQRREAFNQMVGQFPDHAKEIRDLVRNGLDIQGQAQRVIQDLRSNGESFHYQRERKMWESIAGDFAKDEARFFNPAPEVKEADPFNAEVLVTELLSASDEGKKRIDQIKKFTRFVTLPLPPVDPAELGKMTGEDAAKFLEGRLQQYQQNQVKMRRMLPTALAAQALLPGLVKRNQELEAELATLRGAVPPPKGGGAENIQPGDEEVADVRKFTPSNTALADFKENR